MWFIGYQFQRKLNECKYLSCIPAPWCRSESPSDVKNGSVFDSTSAQFWDKSRTKENHRRHAKNPEKIGKYFISGQILSGQSKARLSNTVGVPILNLRNHSNTGHFEVWIFNGSDNLNTKMVHFGGHRVFEPFINRTAFYDSKYREAQYSDPTVVNLKSCVGPSSRIAWNELVQLQLQ